MTTSIFARFVREPGGKTGTGGEVTVDGYKDCVSLKEWSVDAETEAAMEGGGMASGRVKPGVFNFSHAFDLTSPVLMQYLTANQHFDHVAIDMVRIDQKTNKAQVIFRTVLFCAFVAKVSTKTEEAGGMTQEVDMTFRQFRTAYVRQDNLGHFIEKSEIGWDSSAMTDNPPAFPAYLPKLPV